MELFELTLKLFIVMNAFGNIPVFLGLLKRFDLKRQRAIITREMLIALFVFLLFFFFGDDVLRFLDISQSIIGISGGILLFLIALMMIFPKHEHEKAMQHEPVFVPLAVPVIAGPGTITMIMIYSHQLQESVNLFFGITIAWAASLIILLLASNIKKMLGEKGVIACERLGGMLILLIAIKMICMGIITLVQANF